MNDSEIIEEPDVSVHELLWEALEAHAEQELTDKLGRHPDLEEILRDLALELLDGQSRLFVESQSRQANVLQKKLKLLSLPWFKYVVEIELGKWALRRVDKALERYLSLDFGTGPNRSVRNRLGTWPKWWPHTPSALRQPQWRYVVQAPSKS